MMTQPQAEMVLRMFAKLCNAGLMLSQMDLEILLGLLDEQFPQTQAIQQTGGQA